ncbi:hypothetical protein HGRIS_006011 [Hohenbuehelia grisea]|uniref:Uncharacterized protein n=1 Tax=Hohenbuehelia grisea TaxID=104357 RepID=A0ABR3JZN0_9AGAR
MASPEYSAPILSFAISQDATARVRATRSKCEQMILVSGRESSVKDNRLRLNFQQLIESTLFKLRIDNLLVDRLSLSNIQLADDPSRHMTLNSKCLALCPAMENSSASR